MNARVLISNPGTLAQVFAFSAYVTSSAATHVTHGTIPGAKTYIFVRIGGGTFNQINSSERKTLLTNSALPQPCLHPDLLRTENGSFPVKKSLLQLGGDS